MPKGKGGMRFRGGGGMMRKRKAPIPCCLAKPNMQQNWCHLDKIIPEPQCHFQQDSLTTDITEKKEKKEKKEKNISQDDED